MFEKIRKLRKAAEAYQKELDAEGDVDGTGPNYEEKVSRPEIYILPILDKLETLENTLYEAHTELANVQTMLRDFLGYNILVEYGKSQDPESANVVNTTIWNHLVSRIKDYLQEVEQRKI